MLNIVCLFPFGVRFSVRLPDRSFSGQLRTTETGEHHPPHRPLDDGKPWVWAWFGQFHGYFVIIAT